MKTESMSTRRRRRVGLTKKKGRSLQRAVLLHQQFAGNLATKVSSNLHIICLSVPSMCGDNKKMNCGSRSDKSRINECMSD